MKKPSSTQIQVRFSVSDWHMQLGVWLLVTGLALGAGLLSLPFLYADVFAPGVVIDDTIVAGQTYNTATERSVTTIPEYTVTLTASGSAVASTSAELGLQNNAQEVVEAAWNRGKTGPYLQRVTDILSGYFEPAHFSSSYRYDQQQVAFFIEQLQQQIYDPGREPSVELAQVGDHSSLSIDAGAAGYAVDTQKTQQKLADMIGETASVSAEISIPVKVLSETDITKIQDRVRRYVGQQILFSSEPSVYTITDAQLISLLDPYGGFKQKLIDEHVSEIERVFKRETKNAVFEYDPETLVVSSFEPHQTGISVQSTEVENMLATALQNIETQKTPIVQPANGTIVSPEEINVQKLETPVTKIEPEITLADTNDLGIKELIGRGDSEYAHSIPNRVHNVSHTAKKINNYLVAPGEEYSFVKALGEVSQRTGFKSAYIIINGRTELGDGGGVCQVSTTLFRALLDAGVNITKRRPHSYRVSYYELDSKPGVDATVYTGEVDLRFVNDTDNYILIQAETDDENLEMAVTLYGTSDGRSTALVDHTTWGYQPAPPPQYFPDPSLPPGALKKIDNANPGINASFTNIIYDKDGNEVRRDEYVSKYRPWAAKYLQGV